MQKIVVLTGSGISAESGIPTFRADNGFWNNFRIEEVCTEEALLKDRKKVIGFYDNLRKHMRKTLPNDAHLALRELESKYEVTIVTQNIDDLHEKAGSGKIIHLHGEINKLRSTDNPNYIVDINEVKQDPDAKAPDGSYLRPHIVFFGEAVPEIERAAEETHKADIVIVIGTSLVVYPAASLLYYLKDRNVPLYLVDPGAPKLVPVT